MRLTRPYREAPVNTGDSCELCLTNNRLKNVPAYHENKRLQNMSSSSASSTTATSTSPTPSEPYLWDVQEILAERTSVHGVNEVLVQFKAAWIPIRALFDDCPAMQRFKETEKWKFTSGSGAMNIKLPVEPGSVLAQDSEEDKERVAAVAARAPALAAAMRDHTLRAFRCPCSLCAMHAEHLQPQIRTLRSDDAASEPKRQNTGM